MKLGIRLRQSNFENLTQNFAPLELPTPLSHSLERLSKFYSVCIKCLTNERNEANVFEANAEFERSFFAFR